MAQNEANAPTDFEAPAGAARGFGIPFPGNGSTGRFRLRSKDQYRSCRVDWEGCVSEEVSKCKSTF
jgi:hypothetical protein